MNPHGRNQDQDQNQNQQARGLRHDPEATLLPPADTFKASEPPLTLGSCALRDAAAARIVQNALLYFEGNRYYLAAWCVMPNHVHVVLTPLPGHSLWAILKSWKTFTAREINKVLGRTGTFWERESFHHLIRTPGHFEEFVLYTEENPVEAGFCQHPADWRFGSSGTAFQPVPIEFVDPRALPFVEPHNRGELTHLEKEGGSYFVTFRLADAVVYREEQTGGPHHNSR
jgi:REP element-mobilizing transposase RayT